MEGRKRQGRLTATVKFSLPPETHARLEKRARAEGCTKAAIVRRYIAEGVRRYEQGRA